VRITRVLTGYEYAMISPSLALIAAVAATAAGMTPGGIAPTAVRVAVERMRGGPPTGIMAGLPSGASPIARTTERGSASAVARTVPAHRAVARPASAPPPATGLDTARLAQAYARASELPRLRSLLVQWRGELVGERYFRGVTRSTRANIKSASKSIISALVGIAIERGAIRGVDQPIAELLPAYFDERTDPRKRAITVEDLLTMRSGLETTSFYNYGSWVTSRNWVRDALRRPVVAERGAAGPMIYSTGSTHVLSAALTRATGMSTFRFAERYLARPLGIRLRPWTTDPQGIYFGGNDMLMTPRDMVKFGALYLNGGRAPSGRQVVPRAWVERSTQPRTRSGWSGNEYGYGWWVRRAAGHAAYYAWGYGGQFIFVVPDLELVVVTTSSSNVAERERGHLEAIYALLDEYVIPAVDGVDGSRSLPRSAP
jgi:CubicO group peptidase (beta-lactamase class C family)